MGDQELLVSPKKRSSSAKCKMLADLLQEEKQAQQQQQVKKTEEESKDDFAPRQDFKTLFTTVLTVVTLFMAIAAMASAGNVWSLSVTPQQQAEFGQQQFNACKGVIMFFPSVYVFWLLLVLNNSSSIAVWNECWDKGILLVFPKTETLHFLLRKSVLSFAMLISFLAYIAFAAVLFIRFSTPFSVIVLVLKQFVMEVVLFFFLLFGFVNSELPSVMEFVEDCATEHRSDGSGVVTDETIRLAADKLRQLRPALSEPAHLPYAAALATREVGSKNMKLFLYGQYAFMMIGLGVVGWYQYQSDQRDAERDVVQNMITPCVQVCVDRSGAAAAVVETCQSCLCDCWSAFATGEGAGSSPSPAVCSANLAVPQCRGAGDSLLKQVCDNFGSTFCT